MILLYDTASICRYNPMLYPYVLNDSWSSSLPTLLVVLCHTPVLVLLFRPNWVLRHKNCLVSWLERSSEPPTKRVVLIPLAVSTSRWQVILSDTVCRYFCSKSDSSTFWPWSEQMSYPCIGFGSSATGFAGWYLLQTSTSHRIVCPGKPWGMDEMDELDEFSSTLGQAKH